MQVQTSLSHGDVENDINNCLWPDIAKMEKKRSSIDLFVPLAGAGVIQKG